jgi:hypothetical protein
MLYHEGTNVVSTHSGTRGVGLGGGTIGVGFGSSKTVGTSQSQLAAIVAMPTKKYPLPAQGLAAILGGSILLFVISSYSPRTATFLFLAALVVAGYFISQERSRYDKTIWPLLVKRWKGSYMCTCCGNTLRTQDS